MGVQTEQTRASYHASSRAPSFEGEIMMKDHMQRDLAALVVAGLLVGASAALPAQTADQVVPNTETAAIPYQAVPAPAATARTPNPNATPEQIADSLMAHQRYQAAIEHYKKAPRDSAEVWNKMGVAYQLMFNLDDATRCYLQALKLEPRNAVVLNNLGTVYVTEKQYSRAEKMYRKALKIDPKSALVHKNLGTALLAEHKYQKGWQEYQNALVDDPEIFKSNNSVRVENPASIQERGAMNFYMAKGCVRAGQMERAVEYLRMAINEGFTTPKKIADDQEFAGLRDVPAFLEMLAAQRAQ
jgi:Tfp pilus assembly protein PilF